MGVIEAIAEAAIGEVEACGLRFQIRKVTTIDMLSAGKGVLSAIPAEAMREIVDEEKKPKAKKDKSAEKRNMEAALKAIASMTDDQFRDMTANQELIAIAGTIAIEEDGTWRPLTLTADGESDSERNILRVADLPPGCVGALFSGIMVLTRGKEAAARIASFLVESKPGATGRSHRTKAG
jgi:hypothetical protein